MIHTIYLARHGESEANVTFQIARPSDNLTERGRTEVGLLGDHLKDVKFTKVFSSDFARAIQTAEILIAKNNHSKDLKMTISKPLRDAYQGTIEEEGGSAKGMYGTVIKYLHEHGNLDEFVASPGADTISVLKERTKVFYNEELFPLLDGATSPQTVMIASHQGTLWTLMIVLQDLPHLEIVNWDRSCELAMSRNAVYMKLEISSKDSSQKRRLKVLATHEESHLSSLEYESSIKKFVASPEGKVLSGCVHV